MVAEGQAVKREHSIPEGFPDVLKDFVREVLRQQPGNTLKFAAEYFRELANQQQTRPQFDRMTRDELFDHFRQVFSEADTDGSGYLNHREFKRLLKAQDLGLSNKDIRLLLSEADEDNDGRIQYEEFLRLVVELLQALFAKKEARELADTREAEVRADADAFLVHGMHPDEFESMVKDAFNAADEDASGFLDRKEFRQCLKASDLGLTRKEINILMAEVDADDDGTISLSEFYPLFHNIMVEMIVKANLIASDRTSDEIANFLLELFKTADESDSGFLKHSNIRELLRSADLGLTKLQIHAIMSEATQDAQGQVPYREFAPVAADMIWSLIDQMQAADRAAAIEEARRELKEDPRAQKMEEQLRNAFVQLDKDGNGYLDRQEFADCLVNSGLEFSEKELNLLMSAADEDMDGKISTEEFMGIAPRIWEYLKIEEKVKAQRSKKELA
mmetsp:Transcript_49815/g.128165  ORF Transcript_49815/g.128165 Transcript_49815/m.128165 type:complete len:446 (-) Transcript_49815:191-1528(-)|eukprot:CAMPEP_0113893666 /NCGR_PEP_ID=MMETSP0780_2-20120614/16231_1 /TAXON_ID=652834 /ORGANISM="Palpitomonas bilix" /LENGTH=445 /DNA_ID=CAMNT_0000884005 /DNA_START=92 /DNA_END=1429 /DNA_ORIENTATION=- /assembly_acc=CAM_ASM_000599